MKFKPMHDWLFLKEVQIDHKTERGIIMPDQGKNFEVACEVVSVGPGYYHPGSGEFIASELCPGDVVYVHVNYGRLTYMGDPYRLVRERDVFGRFVEDEEQAESKAPATKGACQACIASPGIHPACNGKGCDDCDQTGICPECGGSGVIDG